MRYITGVTQKENGCFFIELRRPECYGLPKKHVHGLGKDTQNTLLRDSLASIAHQSVEASSTLGRLGRIDPSIASMFSVKADNVEAMNMRLHSCNSNRQTFSSYIALSYCWRKKPEVEPSTGSSEYPLPISSSLFRALLTECQSESEGVWCDQICIDQDNEFEKRVAISLMDVVYREARCVVVALEDFTINEAEETFLREYIQSYNGMNLNDQTRRIPRLRDKPPSDRSLLILHELYEKILRSRWFTRAWCAHELRMGKQHAFLVRCTDNSGRPATVFRFDGGFLIHMICLAIEIPGQSNLTSIKVKLREQMTVIDGISKRGQLNNHLDAFSHIFKFDAGGDPKLPQQLRELDANRDKLTIVLNSIGSGLKLNYPLPEGMFKLLATHIGCFHIISLLALAANDPAVLCTSGEALLPGNSLGRFSWLRWPGMHDEDNMALEGRARIDSSRMLINSRPETQTIQLDLVLLGETLKTEQTLSTYIRKAEELIQYCIDNDVGDKGERFYNWRQLVRLDAEVYQKYTQIVACILQCGLPWILDAVRLCGNSFAFHQAVEVAFPLSSRYCAVPDDICNPQYLERSKGYQQVDIVLKFAYYIFDKCLHRPWSSEPVVPWTPYIFSPSSKETYLIFSKSNIGITAAIPTSLLEDDFADLPRVWLLSQEVVGDITRFALQGRSRIFGPSLSRVASSQRVRNLMVFGPRFENS